MSTEPTTSRIPVWFDNNYATGWAADVFHAKMRCSYLFTERSYKEEVNRTLHGHHITVTSTDIRSTVATQRSKQTSGIVIGSN